ncbi:hypothetical protein KI387_004135 [Taxus chinensis]|uniref:TmcB/TmcC TPR repeats domain-containing protein n=1 Tax=Taxus chinensis TaxID=29808 RepID=A0AA38H2S5_TAXCH|nr:hypothetical protein KI387_004135 [Taxus chinensis]
MALKTSRSTPSLVSVGDADLRAPLKTAHLRLISNSPGFRQVSSETDLHRLDKHKGVRSKFCDSPATHKLSIKSMHNYKAVDKQCRGGGGGAAADVNSISVGGGGGGLIGVNTGGNDSNSNEENTTDEYYHKMLEADPGNPLLLRNYARFLHEVKHDMEKAEEYYERAILENPGDGDVLAKYGKLIWELRNDRQRAEMYLDRAVQAAPHDCYVVASHAHFLWSTEEEEEAHEHYSTHASTPTKVAPAYS